MYKFITETNNYEIYNIIETSTFQPILLNIHPFELKLFNNDTFNLPNEKIHVLLFLLPLIQRVETS